MLFEAKNDYFDNPPQIQLCLIMLSKAIRADFELTAPIFQNRLTFDEDLLENALYKGFLKESLIKSIFEQILVKSESILKNWGC